MIRDKYIQFSQWQEHGSQIKEMDMAEVTCNHCGTTYRGNFCPRCGQTRKVSLITKRGFISAFMEAYPQLASAFFRTIKELIGRPGYMIRDYFRGHRVIYFGPFKAFIVVISIFVLLTKFNVVSVVEDDRDTEIIITGFKDVTDSLARDNTTTSDTRERKVIRPRMFDIDKRITTHQYFGPVWDMIKKKSQEKGSLYIFFCVPILAFTMKLACWKQKFDGRRLIYAEHFMVFTYLYVINICFSILYRQFSPKTDYPDLVIYFYMAWAYKGLYGWSWLKTLKQMVPFVLYTAIIGFMVILLIVSIALFLSLH